jgi:dipeptidase D
MIKQLPPLALWEHFIIFCDIPRPSKHEQAIVAYIRQQGENYNAVIEQDKVGNILLRVAATSGYENAPITALQSHVDMVTQANSHSEHNFMTDPLQLQIVDGWLKACDTTLGADNGIGCAAMLALMTDDSVIHGPLELLFTVDEEAGMGGAFGLQPDWLKAKKLLNLDTEEEGEIYMGCAGGIDINSSWSLQWQTIHDVCPDEQVNMSLTGLLGGHSGVDIHLNRANANIILAQELLRLSQIFTIKVQSFNGGTVRNAIPREAYVQLITPDADALIQWINKRNSQLSLLYSASEKEILLTAKKSMSDNITSNRTKPCKVLSKEDSIALISLIASHPNGVFKYSDALPGIVESSNNLGVITLNADKNLSMQNLCRSASDNERDSHAFRITQYHQQFDIKTQITGAYPGWQPNPESPLLRRSLSLYKRLFNSNATTQVIHAGLECGLLSGVYPDCDMISFGPTITGAHSPNEQVNINSVDKFWKYLIAFIADLTK